MKSFEGKLIAQNIGSVSLLHDSTSSSPQGSLAGQWMHSFGTM